MSEIEEKLSAVLSNPNLMQQIMSLAQTMGANTNESAPVHREQPQPTSLPDFDPMLLQTIAQTVGRSGVDSQQTELLRALTPYLSTARVQKLERAMRAVKMAGAASIFLNSGGMKMLTGR